MATTNKPAPFVLTHPTPGPRKCAACGKEMKDMSRHAGSAKCKNEARKAMIARLGLVEVWWKEGDILSDGCVPVVVIWEELAGTKKSKRRRYSEPGPAEVVRTLSNAGLEPKRISGLLRGPKDELERELAIVALAGKREEPRASAHWIDPSLLGP